MKDLKNQTENFFINSCCFFVLVCFLVLKVIHVESVVDVSPWDETSYLLKAIQEQGLYQSSFVVWAPLYSAWYFLLSHFVQTPLELYYLNYKIIIFCLPIVLFFLLRKLKVISPIALVMSFFYIYFMEQVHFTLVGFFAVFVLGILLLAIERVKDEGLYYCFIAVGALAMAYARPEYSVAFILASIVALFYARQSKRVMLFVVLAGTLFFFVKMWGFSFSSSRAWVAFVQHAALQKNHPVIAWREFAEVYFKGCSNFTEAVFLYPQIVFQHCVDNLSNTFWFSIESVRVANHKALLSEWVWPIALLTELLNMSIFVLILWRVWFVSNRIRIVFFIFAFTVWVSSIIIQPMSHYYCVYRFLWLVLAGISLSQILSSKKSFKISAIVAIFLVIGSFTLELESNSQQSWYSKTPNVAIIEKLATIKTSKSIDILQFHGSFGAYLPTNFREVFVPDRQFSWKSFLEENPVDVIVMSENVFLGLLVSDDKQRDDFLKFPQKHGYRKVKISNTPYYLLVLGQRKDIAL